MTLTDKRQILFTIADFSLYVSGERKRKITLKTIHTCGHTKKKNGSISGQMDDELII